MEVLTAFNVKKIYKSSGKSAPTNALNGIDLKIESGPAMYWKDFRTNLKDSAFRLLYFVLQLSFFLIYRVNYTKKLIKALESSKLR